VALAALVAPVAALASACTPSSGAPPGLFGGAIGSSATGASAFGLGPVVAAGTAAAPAGVCQPGEPASLPDDGPSTLAGNPVDVATGRKVDRAVDLHLPPAGGSPALALALTVSRHFDSSATGSDALGPGWRLGLDVRVQRVPAARGPHPRIVQGDGRPVDFVRGEPLRGGGIRHHAARRADGVLDQLSAARGAVRWVWRWRDGRQLMFDASGRLERIVAPDADALALRYDDGGRLVSVADERGRSVELRYHPPNASTAGIDEATGAALEDVDRPGPHAGRLAALVTASGALASYLYDRAGRLAQVVHLGGGAVRYRYAGQRNARLVEVVLPDGRRSTWDYDAQGRVVRSLAAGDPPERALRFVYRPAGEASGDTEVSEANEPGLGAVYRWRRLADGRHRLLQGEGAACRACPPAPRRYGYSGDGQLAWVEAGALRWQVLRDASGRPVSVRRSGRPAGDGELETVAEVRWRPHPILDLPARILRPSVVAEGFAELRLEHAADGRLVSATETGWGRNIAGEAVPIRRHWPAAEDGAWPSDLADVLRAARSAGLEVASGQERPDEVRLTSAAGARWTYRFDDFGRIATVHSSDGGRLARAYDAAGRLAGERQEGVGEAIIVRDAEGRIVEHRVAAGADRETVTRFTWSRDGRLAGIDHPAQSERFRYDSAGRLLERAVRLELPAGGSREHRLHYRWDEASGRLRARSLPDGSWLLLERHAAGAVVALRRLREDGGAPQTLAEGIVAGPGAPARVVFGNGVVALRTGSSRAGGVRILHARPGAEAREAIVDQMVVFDARGNAVTRHDAAARRRYRYDAHDRLIESLVQEGPRLALHRFHHDADGNRLFEQHATLDAAGLASADARHRLDPSSQRQHSRTGHADGARRDAESTRRVGHDAAGRVVADGVRGYRWTAQGLLAEAREGDRLLARYRYNHRGERVSKEVGGRHTLYLVEDRRVLAELDAQGRVLRQYVHLGEAPLAVIDRVPGRPAGRGSIARAGERVAWLHLNHLGAPEAASDRHGRVIWRADYSPYGRAAVTAPALGTFVLALRLPGQHEDPETGLHYNDHRYYDPDTGRYLSPDPLGIAGGAHAYLYAAANPLRNVDPSGLLLFAFDGTGNSDPPPRRDDLSNVVKLARSYADGRVWYMSGVGRDDPGSGIAGGTADAVDGRTARTRVSYMLGELDRYVAGLGARSAPIAVDVIGFSRGASMARDFANRVADGVRDGSFSRQGVCLSLRFVGLWDTVAQFGVSGMSNAAWRLSVPAEAAYAAHAVALNEHRTLFPGESIVGSPLAGVRIERGFVGAHSDVGGSYAEGDLADVALVWMHDQARRAGLRMATLPSEFTRVTNPLLHDSDTDGVGDREFLYRNTRGWAVAGVPQRLARVDGMQWRDTLRFIDRFGTPRPDAYGEPTLVGNVLMPSYASWLASSYGIALAGP
jgi:RHS repeat-associated protein